MTPGLVFNPLWQHHHFPPSSTDHDAVDLWVMAGADWDFWCCSGISTPGSTRRIASVRSCLSVGLDCLTRDGSAHDSGSIMKHGLPPRRPEPGARRGSRHGRSRSARRFAPGAIGGTRPDLATSGAAAPGYPSRRVPDPVETPRYFAQKLVIAHAARPMSAS